MVVSMEEGEDGEDGSMLAEESMAAGKDVGNGWLRFWDPAENEHYYYHPDTEETSWDPPGHLLQGKEGAGENDEVKQCRWFIV